MSSSRTLPRPPRVPKVNTANQNYLDIPDGSSLHLPPLSAPTQSDNWNRFDFTKTLSRTESKVNMRRRQGSRSTNSSIRRKNSVSLFFSGSSGGSNDVCDDVRNSGHHWQELLVNPEIPGEILCRFFSLLCLFWDMSSLVLMICFSNWISIVCEYFDLLFTFPLADRKKDSSLELLVHGLHLTKTDLKKMEKLTKINIHLHGE